MNSTDYFLKRSRIFCLATLALLVAEVYAAPPLVNYQGFLTDAGGQPLNEVTSVTFRIWTKLDAASSTLASDLVWAEKHAAVSVVDGRINVILGNGTPVTADLGAATNAVDNIGEAFREDATYIGITINDVNDQYDPGEEITPRQQLLSVPYALNNSTSTVDDVSLPNGAVENDYVGKVVELLPQSTEVRLAQDHLWQIRMSHRGVYLAGGRVQFTGVVNLLRDTPLTPGLPVYLSNLHPGEVVDADATEMQSNERVAATKIGIPIDESRVVLTIQPVNLAVNPLPEGDRFPLFNPGFTNGDTGWTNANTIQSRCGMNMMASRGVQTKIYQRIELKNYLKPLVDAGALQARFGAVTNYDGGSASGVYFLDFHVAPPEGAPGAVTTVTRTFEVPLSSACTEHSKTVTVPPFTTAITFGWNEINNAGYWTGRPLLEIIPFEPME